MIKRIYADNFRCMSNFTFEPERINLIMGPNGGGKTSLFDVVMGIVRCACLGWEVRTAFGVDTLTRWDTRTEQRFELDVLLGTDAFSYVLRLAHDRDQGRVAIVEETVVCGGVTLFAYRDGKVCLHDNAGRVGASFPFRPARSFLAEIEPRPENTRLMVFRDYLNGTRSLKLLPASIESQSDEESPGLRCDGANFASWYRNLAQERSGELYGLFDSLSKVIPGFDSLALVGTGKQGRTRDLVVRFKTPDGQKYDVDFAEISDGQRVLIILYTLLLDLGESPGLLLLDEPENYVALYELQPWLHALDDALGDAGQLLMISHHPEVIDFLAAETPYLFDRIDGGPLRVQPAVFDRDSGLSASEQITRGLLSNG
jgi:ABC-type transport system involved in cytochrome c biogenesis ATPase subunit